MAIKAGDGIHEGSAESAGSSSRVSSALWPLGPVTLVATAALVGLVVGGVTQVLQAHLDSPWLSLVNAASPWLFFAFVVGAAARRLRHAAGAGLILCAGELAGYYGTAHERGIPASTGIMVFWAVCGLIGGPLFGAGGLLWRRATGWTRGLGPALLGGSFLAEAADYQWNLHYHSTALLFAVIGVAAAALAGLRASQLPRTGLWFCAVLPAGLLAEAVLNTVYNHSF